MSAPADGCRRQVPSKLAPGSVGVGSTGSRGFTLIELMVAMVVSAIVVLGIFAFSSIQQSTTNIHERNVRVQQALEGALWSVGQDVRAAGMGWARMCTELRVWDATAGRRINPGGENEPTNTYADLVTGERLWVLRDGIQAFWDSTGATDFPGPGAAATRSSANPGSAADAFDVIIAEPNYTGTANVFTMSAVVIGTDTFVTVETGPLLDNTNPAHMGEVRQLFPPGSFVVMAAIGDEDRQFRPETQKQCPLLQITGDVVADPANAQRFRIPIDNTSGFNADLTALLADDGVPEEALPEIRDDWDGTINAVGSSIIPLGRLRWSRYEIDYAVAEIPYLVRYDIIGYIDGVDTTGLGAFDYPHCSIGTCPMPGLHLPGAAIEPRAVAIGPMIEDMQVAVACDGYTVAGATGAAPDVIINVPDVGFAEVGPAEGMFPLLPNTSLDENTNDSALRHSDEWLGNAAAEQFAPDCVWYGTAEYDAADWAALEGSPSPPPPFRMSPQAIRITLVASSEFTEEAGGLSTTNIIAIEDRAVMASPVGARQRFTLTEMFTPENLRWRDAQIQ